MTYRDLYDAALVETNKLEAPSLLLEDYNYLINKAIQQKVNKSYNTYEMNQQATDDLLALKVSAKLEIIGGNTKMPNETDGYFCIMPDDYWHILNCVVNFENNTKSKCDSETITSLARKLTSDLYPSIINNAYFKPSYKNPYYRVIKQNINSSEDAINSILHPCDENITKTIIDVRCGNTSKYKPKEVYIDYLKTPSIINLTYDDLTSEIDNTPTVEFPTYICYEIINEFVKLLLENSSDPRLQTNIPINATIGNTMSSNQ